LDNPKLEHESDILTGSSKQISGFQAGRVNKQIL